MWPGKPGKVQVNAEIRIIVFFLENIFVKTFFAKFIVSLLTITVQEGGPGPGGWLHTITVHHLCRTGQTLLITFLFTYFIAPISFPLSTHIPPHIRTPKYFPHAFSSTFILLSFFPQLLLLLLPHLFSSTYLFSYSSSS